MYYRNRGSNELQPDVCMPMHFVAVFCECEIFPCVNSIRLNGLDWLWRHLSLMRKLNRNLYPHLIRITSSNFEYVFIVCKMWNRKMCSSLRLVQLLNADRWVASSFQSNLQYLSSLYWNIVTMWRWLSFIPIIKNGTLCEHGLYRHWQIWSGRVRGREREI